jgi:uncharacterized repeat protein (TIGR03803 family)
MLGKLEHGRIASLQASATTTLGIIVILASIGLAAQNAPAQTFSVLYTFKGSPDGGVPKAGLIRGPNGTLFGTTWGGGATNCDHYGCGVAFKLDPAGKETVLYRFKIGSGGGANPTGTLVRDAIGNLYGSASSGGGSNCGGNLCGTVFELNRAGKETVLHYFNGADGDGPGGLVRDSSGNLYGTAAGGATYGQTCVPNGCGTVFEIDANGVLSTLHAFKGGSDGDNPEGAVVRDGLGTLYGTTAQGGGAGCVGFGCGTVFKVDKNHNESVLHIFVGGTDGSFPSAGLVRDASGNLYGTTFHGGNIDCDCGTVFKVDKTGNETILYSFTGGADGANPAASLVLDSEGNLYGTTVQGGTAGCDPYSGCGVVFELDTVGTESVLYSFTGGADGANPAASVMRDSAGNLYGTTQLGGGTGCNGPGCGVVFKIAP